MGLIYSRIVMLHDSHRISYFFECLNTKLYSCTLRKSTYFYNVNVVTEFILFSYQKNRM